MGGNTSKKPPPVIATCNAPMYVVKKLGSRHILLGGGGGAANTGVKNQIEEHVITFSGDTINGCNMKAALTHVIDTEKESTMNMDIVCVANSDRRDFLIAAGHSEYCDIYETGDYFSDTSKDQPALGINFRFVGRIRTDFGQDESYQKCVGFDKSKTSDTMKMVTGGTDGHIRLWDVADILNDRNPAKSRKPILELNAHPGEEVEGVDISPDGRFCFTIGKSKVILWDIVVGKQLQELPFPPELVKGFKVRSLRFTSLGSGGSNFVFAVAYNQIQRNSKAYSYMALWVLNRETLKLRPIVVKKFQQGEAISSLTISPCGNYTGVGTLAGSVAIFDSHEMDLLFYAKETHGIFVTSVEFLDRIANDIVVHCPEKNNKPIEIPGPAADCRACIVSLSADQTVQVHKLPFKQSVSTTLFLVKLMIFSNILYFFIWMLARL